jgi:hypothetical protein
MKQNLIKVISAMNKSKISSVFMLPLLALSILSLNQCDINEDAIYRRIRDHADQVRVINTHEHQHWPEEFGDYHFRFYHLIAASYLASDVSSAGANGYDWNLMDSLSLDELWDVYGKALDYTRSTSYYSQLVRGFKKQYDFNDLYFTKENIAGLSGRIEDNYKNYKAWFDEAFNRAGFELMFLDQYWKSFNTEIDERYFALVFNINSLVSESGKRPDRGSEPNYLYKAAAEEGFEINNLDDYLKYCDHLLKKNINSKVVCLKNSQAYSRTLYYEDVPYEEARTLYEKPSSRLTPSEAKKIEDFMFHWIIQKSIEYDLPVQIHTGYLAGNGNVLDNGQPIKLNNIFLKYQEAKFVLFHGGFPWTGEIAAFGKMFPNVYIDLVWLPQISREEAVDALDVMLDCVPYNKFFWGGDCGLIEESTGSLEFARDVVSEVLANRVERDLLTEDAAFTIIERIFRENAIEVFQLEKRLGRDF